MKNLIPTKQDPYEFYTEVVKNKRVSADEKEQGSSQKARVSKLCGTIETAFKNYGNNFQHDSWELLTPIGYAGLNKTDLLSLYRYKATKFTLLKNELTTDDKNCKFNTCQYCTINSINSFDHYVPKNDYPEYAANPLNLLTCCTECNSYKSEKWLKNSSRYFINLYLDQLPKERFLFVDISIISKIPNAKFRLDLSNITNISLATKINNHYTGLHLLKRFEDNYATVISELDNSIRAHLSIDADLSKVVAITKGKCLKDYESFGFNYWKTVLTEALMSSPDYLALFTS